MEILERVNKLATEVASKQNLKVHKVFFASEEEGKVLHIELDKKGGVSLIDIVNFTEIINPLLDEEKELDFEYSLDCSSCGAERFVELEELKDLKDEYMEVTTSKGKFLGTLIDVNDEEIVIKYFIKGRPKKETIKIMDITKAQLRVKL